MYIFMCMYMYVCRMHTTGDISIICFRLYELENEKRCLEAQVSKLTSYIKHQLPQKCEEIEKLANRYVRMYICM